MWGLSTLTLGNCPKQSQKGAGGIAQTTDSGSCDSIQVPFEERRTVCIALTLSASVYTFEAGSFGYAGLHR